MQLEHVWLDHLRYFGRWVVAGLALAFVVVWLRPELLTRGADTHAPFRGYAAAVSASGPSVVNIYADRIITEQPSAQLDSNPAARRFLGPSFTPSGPPRQRVDQSLGSAVIARADGYLLTNRHVIENKDRIRALLWDGRTTDARVVATDPETDLAVLKIDVEDLPAIRFAGDNRLQIGDVVLAIGNPFGLGQSVTMGIVSALGAQRLNLLLADYENMIQTDAAINSGNSGGALVNASGELVGINTVTFARNNGGEGISFAIPAETARAVLDDIIRQGYVTRGWIGIDVSQVEVGNRITGERRIGLQIQSIAAGSPAEAGGLRVGDILMGIDGGELGSLVQFRTLEANRKPGERIPIEAVRAGLPFMAYVILMQKPRIAP